MSIEQQAYMLSSPEYFTSRVRDMEQVLRRYQCALCMPVYPFVHCVYGYICACSMYVCSMCLCMYVCSMYVCMYVCMYAVCMYVCMYAVCVYVCMQYGVCMYM